MLAGVRPSGDAPVVVAARGAGRRGGRGRRAWPTAAPPLRGTTTADVVIVGGGYTGLWTALRLDGARARGAGRAPRGGHLRRRAVGAQRRVRHGLVGRAADAHRAVRRGRGASRSRGRWTAAVDELGAWCAEHGVDAWYTKAGSLSVSAAPAQDGKWLRGGRGLRGARGRATATCALTADEVRGPGRLAGVPRRGRSCPAPRPSSRRSSPAACARVLLERGVVDPRGHDASSSSTASGRAGSARSAPGRRRARRPGRRRSRPVRIRTTSAAGRGRGPRRLRGRRAQRLGRGVAVVRPAARDLVELHRADRADPGPPRGARLDRRRGPRRRPVHAPLPAHDPRRPDRHRRRRRPGRVRRPDRRGLHRRRDCRGAVPRPACGGSSRRCATSASRTPGAARSTSPPTTCRGSATRPGPADPLRPRLQRQRRRRRRSSAGRLLAGAGARTRRRSTRRWRPRPLVGGRARGRSRRSRSAISGRGSIREAIVRREAAEERGEHGRPVLREVTPAAAAARLPPLARTDAQTATGPPDTGPAERRVGQIGYD